MYPNSLSSIPDSHPLHSLFFTTSLNTSSYSTDSLPRYSRHTGSLSSSVESTSFFPHSVSGCLFFFISTYV